MAVMEHLEFKQKAMNKKTFIQAEIYDLLGQVNREEISFSKMVEILNEKAHNKSLLEISDGLRKNNIPVFAKHATKERVAVFIDPSEGDMQKILNAKFGGNWVYVGDFSNGDMIKFESEDVYLGFDGRKNDNYCKAALIKTALGRLYKTLSK